MVVWVINPFDDVPGEGKPQRFWKLCETLSAQGHEVVWWSSNFSHRRKARRTSNAQHRISNDEPGVQQLESEIFFSLRLVSTPSYTKNISVARIWSHRKFGQNLYRDACAAIDSGELCKPDLVFASMPPMEGPIVALELKKRFNCVVVTDVMDAWPHTLLQVMPKLGGVGTFLGNLVLRPYWKMLSNSMRGSDAISAQSESFEKYARDQGFQGPSHVCYLGADPIPCHNDKGEPNPALRLVYIGAMGRSYDLETMLEAVRALHARGVNIELHIAGEGEKLQLLQALASGWGDSVVTFHGYLDREALIELLKQSDVGLIPMYPASGVSIPYKAGDYLAVGLPIINSLGGELDELLEANACGSSYEAGNCESLMAVMTTFADQSSENQIVAKANARKLFESHFNRERTYPKFSRWLGTLSS